MGLDIGPDRSQNVGQQQAPRPDEAAPDPVQTLARQSGVSAEALSVLSPPELAGMQHLEQMVAQHEQTGALLPHTLAGMIAARDKVRAEVAGRIATSSTQDGAHAQVAEQEVDGFETLRTPSDARLSIRGNQAVFEVNIHLFGSGATPEVARAFERQIQHDWGQNPATGAPWTHTTVPGGQTYNVRFDVNVDVVSTRRPEERQALIDRQHRPSDLDNYIEVVDAARARQLVRSGVSPHENGFRSNVNRVGGDVGQWQGYDRGRTSVLDVSDASHEFGHLLGFRDRYRDQTTTVNGSTVVTSEPDPGYENNIMGRPAGQGRVTQTMIDNLMTGPMFQQLASRRHSLSDMPITGPVTE